jgi:hypothetical protein
MDNRMLAGLIAEAVSRVLDLGCGVHGWRRHDAQTSIHPIGRTEPEQLHFDAMLLFFEGCGNEWRDSRQRSFDLVEKFYFRKCSEFLLFSSTAPETHQHTSSEGDHVVPSLYGN